MKKSYLCPLCLREIKIRSKKRGKRGKEFFCRSCGVRVTGKGIRDTIRNIHNLYDYRRIEKNKDSIMLIALKSINQKKHYTVQYNSFESEKQHAYILEARIGKFLSYTLRIKKVDKQYESILRGRKDHDVSAALHDILGYCIDWDSYVRVETGEEKKNDKADK